MQDPNTFSLPYRYVGKQKTKYPEISYVTEGELGPYLALWSA